jgi:uncharacterized delta-60 repeat protein
VRKKVVTTLLGVGIVCFACHANAGWGLARVTASGALDTQFGPPFVPGYPAGGTIMSVVPEDSTQALCVVPGDDPYGFKRMITGGYVWMGNAYRGIVRRYHIWGEPDATFSTGAGQTLLDYAPNTQEFVRAVGRQSTSKIIAAGEAINSDFTGLGRFVVWRLNADGTPDTTFGTNGKATAFLGGARVWDLVILPDDRILVAGSISSQVALARFTAGGALDTTFSGDGLVTASWGNPPNLEEARGMDLDGDKIVITGRASGTPTTRMGAMRFTSGGSLDTTFSDDGKTVIDFPGGVNEVGNDVDCLPGQGCFVVGSFQDAFDTRFAIARLTNAGNIEPVFGMRINTFPGYYWAMPTRVAANAAGVTVLGTAFPSSGGPGQMVLARYAFSGLLDITFNSYGWRTVAFPTVGDITWGTALTFDGTSVLAVGDASE